jgi:hypothetical protein
VSIAALVAQALLARGAARGPFPFRRRAALRTGALGRLPWLTLAGFAAAWTEQRYPPPALRNADGSPALVDAPPPNAPPLGARFALPVVLEAAQVLGPDSVENVAIDLYLRRIGAIPRTTTMFVHVVRRGGAKPASEEEKEEDGRQKTRKNVDHQVVGGSFYLSDAPLNRVVHDAFGLQTGKLARGPYDVWVGFGHVSGRRGRAAVVDPGSGPGAAEVEDDLVRVGSFVLP